MVAFLFHRSLVTVRADMLNIKRTRKFLKKVLGIFFKKVPVLVDKITVSMVSLRHRGI